MLLIETLKKIRPIDEKAMKQCEAKWDLIAKPLKSLGKIETNLTQIAGIQRSSNIKIEKRALVIMCSDNGIVAQGVTQTGQEVTAIVAENFLNKKSCASLMCEDTKTDIFPIDIGMAVDTPGIEKRKIAYGTKNFYHEHAMTRREAVRAIHTGIQLAEELKNEGYQLIATGEMGIGNTTTSSAVLCALTNLNAEEVTGRGSGLSTEAYLNKIDIIKTAIKKWEPDYWDPIDVLSKVGGFDLAGLTGIYLGCARNHIPVVIDGFISATAALCAVRLCSISKDYMLASHVSNEPAGALLLKILGKDAMIEGNMCLGEGTGALMLLPLLDMGLNIYNNMSTFRDINIETYVPLD